MILNSHESVRGRKEESGRLSNLRHTFRSLGIMRSKRREDFEPKTGMMKYVSVQDEKEAVNHALLHQEMILQA